MKKNLFFIFSLLLFLLCHTTCIAQTNACQGTIQASALAEYGAYTTIGNGTPGCVKICITANSLGTGMCSGNAEQIVIRNTAGSIRAQWISTTATGTCVTMNLNDGYARLSKLCLSAGADATLTWETVDCSTGANVCCTPNCTNGIQDCNETGIDCGGPCSPCSGGGGGNPDYIGSAQGIDACGVNFNVSNTGATSVYSSTQAGCGTSLANLDCNTTTSHSGTAGNDVPWSIENDIWYMFCPTDPASWTVTISSPPCSNSGGYQYAIFQGTPTNLHTQFFASTCQQTQGLSCVVSMNGTQSTTINVTNTTDCIYLVIDGHAGAVCNFSVSLTTTDPACELIPMPVELISFHAEDREREVSLSWITASELNNDYFSVERSKEGKTFEVLAKVKGETNSTQNKKYNVTDANPPAGVVYYRLKQTDFDGSFTYSEIVAVHITKDSKLKVYPNPVKNTAEISFEGLAGEDVPVYVYDYSGKIVWSKVVKTVKGINTLSIDSQQFLGGIYFLHIAQDQNPQKIRFVKE